MTKYLRKVIRIKAEDSPNVQLALRQQAQGLEPTGEVLLPGVLDWNTYKLRRATWNKILQCISLDGEFYEGEEQLLFPPEWLNLAEQYAATLPKDRKGEAMGVDTAAGGDNTCWSIIDRRGLIKLISLKTPNTAIITNKTIALIKEYGIPPQKVAFDQGGGGHEHANYLQAQGYQVTMVPFGGSVDTVLDELDSFRLDLETKESRFGRYAFKNRRAEMYWKASRKLEPKEGLPKFGIPLEYSQELRRQLAVIPRLYDEEGKLYLPPKRTKPNARTISLEELLGCSPDEADSFALAVHALGDLGPKDNKPKSPPRWN